MNALQAIAAGNSIKILPYSNASASAKEVLAYIKEKYDAKAALRARDPVRTKAFIIRWGTSGLDYAPGLPVLNQPICTTTTSNKFSSFEAMRTGGVRVPDYTKSPEVASAWLKEHTIVARHTLNSHSGAGIQIVTQQGTVYKAPDVATNTPWYAARLFTRYVKKASEYRVFVVGQSAVFAYRKGADTEVPPDQRQFYVRTHATGWNFCSVELSDVPEDVIEQAILASTSCLCHFSAVDVGWNEHKQEATVYEVNSAPGISGGSVPKFVDALMQVPHDMKLGAVPPQPVPADRVQLYAERAIAVDFSAVELNGDATVQVDWTR